MGFRNTAHYEPAAMDAANEDTKMLFSQDFRHAVWTITATGFTGTIKFYSSNMETRPDLDSAVSATNEYDTVDVVYLGGAVGGDTIAGDTGYTGSTSTETFQVEINENANKWLGIVMTARTAGSVKASIDLYDNA